MPQYFKINLIIPEITKTIPILPEEALTHMKSNNPDILSYRQQVLESEQEVERSSKTAGFDASFSASIGFNQAGKRLYNVYQDLSSQDIALVSIKLPILDWGIKKGRANMAKKNLNVTKLTVQQNEQELEQEVIATVVEFNKQQRLILRSVEALQMAIASYNINKQRFIVGMTDISALTLSLNRREEAQRNYITTLNNYWNCYYTIRKLTLFDFERQEALYFQFERILK